MKNWMLNLILMVLAGNVFAHQADISSTVLSEQSNNQWVLQVKASLTAFQYEVKTNFGENAYTSPEEFEALVIRLMMENISIVFDGNQAIEIKKGLVKLGHETNVIFEVVGVPKEFNALQFKNSAFKNIHKNRSTLVILKKDFKQNRFELNNNNKHAVDLEVANAQIVEVKEANVRTRNGFNFLSAFALLTICGLAIFLKIKPLKKQAELFMNNNFPH